MCVGREQFSEEVAFNQRSEGRREVIFVIFIKGNRGYKYIEVGGSRTGSAKENKSVESENQTTNKERGQGS